MPEYVEDGWSVFDDPVFKDCMSQITGISLLSDVTLWLPFPKESIFVSCLPTGNEAHISTLQVLKQELDELNRQTWNADEPTILSWRENKYYEPVKQSKVKLLFGSLFSKNSRNRYRTEDLAQCAFSILYQTVNFALDHDVPVLLDY
ncbi:MAG: hypothetical protein NC098_08490 [Lachnoclostridium sp.]|nr:hypothetical protein [Lachnoclostridium sp.]